MSGVDDMLGMDEFGSRAPGQKDIYAKAPQRRKRFMAAPFTCRVRLKRVQASAFVGMPRNRDIRAQSESHPDRFLLS